MKLRSSFVVATMAVLLLLLSSPPVHAQTRPALIRDIDRSSAQPVNGFCSTFLNGGFAKCTLFTVPAGKRLIVETVSYYASVEAAKNVIQIQFGQGDAYTPYTNALFGANLFVLTPVLVFSDSSAKSYAGTQALKMYLDEGSIMIGGVQSTGVVSYQQSFGFSGYLVDK